MRTIRIATMIKPTTHTIGFLKSMANICRGRRGFVKSSLRFVWSVVVLCAAGCASVAPQMKFENYTLDYDTPLDSALQNKLEAIDTRLREEHGMTAEQTALG